MIELTNLPLDTAAALQRVSTPAAGATVLFVGTTRQFTAGRETTHLVYEAYEAMAQRKLEALEAEAQRRWPIASLLIAHRLGEVGLGEASVLVAVSTAHRDAAFASAAWLMDRLKQEVPIWKQEHWADGQVEWQHPIAPAPSSPPGATPDRSAETAGDGT